MTDSVKEPSTTNDLNRGRIDDRQVTELIGIARGLVADGEVNNAEFEYLYKWLTASKGAVLNPLVGMVFDRMSEMAADNIIDDDERAELVLLLNHLCGNDFELGEALKSTTLPLNDPAPGIIFPRRTFVFTGTFNYGPRKKCAAITVDLGGIFKNHTAWNTDYLVIGEYSTDAWMQSSFGRKIEDAVEMRKEEGATIAIVAESHWRNAVETYAG